MRTQPLTGGTIEADAKAAVLSMLYAGNLSAARLASALGLSLRTLQRRLAAEGTSYSALLEEVRFEIAMPRIASGRETLADLSANLGYANQSVLTRAVCRWTGKPPSRIRAGARA